MKHGLQLRHEAILRLLDVLIATAILLFIAPLLIIIAVVVKLQDGGPVFFAHRRIGRAGQLFHCLKFRTMLVDSEARLRHLLATDECARAEWAETRKLRNDPRITPFGAFLRKSSLDELPQFLNVLSGAMSVVGPRPIVEEEANRYGTRFTHYAAVRPGITGLWQIGGRNDVSYGRRVAFDVLYCRMRSPILYLVIVLKTVPAVMSRAGSY